MSGMNANTGRRLSGDDHIRQSISDILTTRQGSRIERREYGSMIPELIDHPANAATILRLQAATVIAIARWEPRVRITKTAFSVAMDGSALIGMEAVHTTGARAGEAISMAVKAN